MNYSDSIKKLKGIGSKKKEKLENLGMHTIWDLLNYKPFKYQDRRNIITSDKFIMGKQVLASGKIISKKLIRISRGRSMLDCKIMDSEGIYYLRFFNMPYLLKNINISTDYLIFGEIRITNGKKTFINPEITKSENNQLRGIIPVYRCVKGITNNDLRRWVKETLKNLNFENELIDESIRNKRKLCKDEFAYKNIHFPENIKAYQAARYKLFYNEMLSYQIAILKSREQISKNGIDSSIMDIDISPFIKSIGFELTKDQIKAINDIEKDLISEKPMNRLIQGDVGSGKTVVSQAAIYKVIKSGGQVAFMVPTEVLSKQHFINFKKEFDRFGIKTAILTGNTGAKERKETLDKLKDGSIDIIVGTHALIQDDISFKKLMLVITDEQHRFGVNQRKNLVDKNETVNIIVMSATPIPRTLASTVFGDMDFSIIKTKPYGRKEIITRAVDNSKRELAYKAVAKEVEKGHQAFIIASAISENDFELEPAEKLYREMKARFKDRKVALIHGKLAGKEKERIMQEFSIGNIDILVSTVVIEVGIDVPNATIMVIENAERYGLAQLHQLRGRVGRSEIQSYCYLVRYSNSENSISRINAMVKISDGFEISEEDFRLRGPGDITGTIQHGIASNIISDMYQYQDLADICLKDAKDIVDNDYKGIDKEQLNLYLSNIYGDYSYII